ncbi:MAG: radical SAM family heme chaperone HemW [Deltaproteobacteria bacterium]|nr:radical SAM family heme chaperone HemW [Deltaproteobacteria bacterium]MBW2563298.1 radical SAM family heme chaperone HemW [Deltaproteobacteria bacterium]
MNSNPNKPGGIYVHIPFCVKKCPYCDFYSITDTSLKQKFISAVISEMNITCNLPFKFDTLYIGGGTPSVLETEFITRIIENVSSLYKLLPDSEITIEVNPGTVKPEKLKEYKNAGVNRISIGVQSFQERNLNFLGRMHTVEDTDLAIQWARDAGFENIGIDLIYGIVGQTRESWLRDLEQAVSYEPEHLSCYMLTYESGTPIERDRQKGLFKPMNEGKVGELFATTIEFLADKGYAQYEISNFAYAKNIRSRHNQKYWSFAPYIGLGPSAHSFIEPRRCWNKASVTAYIKDLQEGKLPIDGQEVLSREQMMSESIFLGLRRADGIDVSEFNSRFDENFFKIFGKQIDDFEKKGLIVTNQTSCALTVKGMLFLDSIASMLVSQDF